MAGVSSLVCSEDPFIGPRREGSGVQTWARVRVSAGVPVATVVLGGHGHVWRSCGDVGSVVAQQGDEGSSGTAGAKEVTGGDFSSSFSVVAWHELGQGMAGDVEVTQGTDSASVGVQVRPCLHCLQQCL
jgi:hypothetical protein